MNRSTRRVAVLTISVLATFSLFGQNPPPEPPPSHDIRGVDPVHGEGAISTPLPERQQRQLKKYSLPELTGARQAIGSQLIDGELPRPLVDYMIRSTQVDQRISLFEGGLVVIRMSGAGGVIHNRVIIPADAMANYLAVVKPQALAKIGRTQLSEPPEHRRALLRIYEAPGKFVERTFDPAGVRPKALQDHIEPLEDLLRVLSEDRGVTSTVAQYEPKVGDQLVADDRKVWRVARIVEDSGIVELRCTSAPTIMYVAKKDLYNYFVGRPSEE